MVTLKKIAEEADVSISAVSHFLNGRRNNLSKATSERIGLIVDKYQYQPNRLVRGIQRRRTGCLGVVVPSCAGGYYPSTLDWIERAARDAGYSMLLAQSHLECDLLEKAVNVFRGLRVDGLIIVPSYQNQPFYEKLVEIGTKIVFLDGYFDPPVAPAVRPDDEMSVVVALEHLWRQGHRQIGFLAGLRSPLPFHGVNRRPAAFRNWMQSRGCETPDDLVDYEQASYESRSALRLIREKKCTAIVASSDMPLHYSLKGLRDHGVRVPEDVALVGMGNFPESERSSPPLSSIDHNREMMAAEMIRLMTRLLENEGSKLPLEEIQIPPKLIVRESSRSAPSGVPRP